MQTDKEKDILGVMHKMNWNTLQAIVSPQEKLYIEPEQDEQGVLYGYKVLILMNEQFVSPVRRTLWNKDGSLESDYEPSEKNTSGIYCTKMAFDKEIQYLLDMTPYFNYPKIDSFLVKCALSGTIVEGETGFRAQYAQIVEVCENGHWQAYQNSPEHSDGNTDWEAIPNYEAKKRFIEGNWDTSG